VREYEAGNSKNTVLFVKYLQSLNKGARILIFWDGATYHKYGEMRDDLGLVNQDLEKSEWLIICELFTPNSLLAKPCRRYLASSQKNSERTLVSM
jgi:hypothetical protein